MPYCDYFGSGFLGKILASRSVLRCQPGADDHDCDRVHSIPSISMVLSRSSRQVVFAAKRVQRGDTARHHDDGGAGPEPTSLQ